jgi:hypothetical protein
MPLGIQFDRRREPTFEDLTGGALAEADRIKSTFKEPRGKKLRFVECKDFPTTNVVKTRN